MPYDALDRLERLFHAARLHPVAERAAFLAAACADDPALQRELAALLEADALAEGDALLDVPAAGVAAEAVGPDAPALLPDSQVGPYKVLRRIGAGGMGDVYLAAREVPARGQDEEAETVLRRALALRQQVLKEHPSTADGLLFLATFLHEKGRLDEARAFHQEALTVLRKSHREEHVAVQQIYADMADRYEAWGKRSLADQYRARRAPPDAAGRP